MTSQTGGHNSSREWSVVCPPCNQEVLKAVLPLPKSSLDRHVPVAASKYHHAFDVSNPGPREDILVMGERHLRSLFPN